MHSSGSAREECKNEIFADRFWQEDMRHSIRIRLALIFVIVILILTSLITFINIRMALDRLQKDLQAESGKALNNAGDVIVEYAKRVNNLAALLADTGEVKDSLKSGNIQEWLNANRNSGLSLSWKSSIKIKNSRGAVSLRELPQNLFLLLPMIR